MGNLKKHRDNFYDSLFGKISPVTNINFDQPESENNITKIVTTTEGETSLVIEYMKKIFPQYKVNTIPGLLSPAAEIEVPNTTQGTVENANGEALPEPGFEEEEIIPWIPPSPTGESPSPPASPSEGDNGNADTPKAALKIESSVIDAAKEIANNPNYKDQGFSADRWTQIANATSEELKNISQKDKALFVLIYRLAFLEIGSYSSIDDIESLRQ